MLSRPALGYSLAWGAGNSLKGWYDIQARWLFYVFPLSRSRMDSISEIWFYRLRFCFGWQVRCCVLCVSGEKCPSVSQTVETRALKADKEVKDKKKANRTDWLTSPFPPGLVVGLHGLGCQWMRRLLCARPLYRCHLSRKQRHNSWVNCPSSSPTPRFTSLNPTHTHSESIRHHS